MKWLRKGLIWGHRYLGIALSLLFVIWFVSGIGMMFAGGMPRLDPQERLQRIPEIDLSQIRLSPTEAAARVQGGRGPDGQRGARGQGGARRRGGGAGEAGARAERGRGQGERRGARGTEAPQGNAPGDTPAPQAPAQEQNPTQARDGEQTQAAEGQAAAQVRQGGGRGGRGGGVSIRAFLGRPVYRIGGRTVFADDGSVQGELGEETARRVASQFMNIAPEKMEYTLATEVDQWTLGQRGFPLHRFTVDDGQGTVLYISPQSGDVVLKTTRATRALAWVAAIPHWFYVKSLRVNQPLWYRTVVWTSVFGCILALFGIALSFTQLKVSRPFKLSRITSYIPYSGWMRWHYITGAVFGVLTFTWLFSGLLSMEPLGWAAGPTLQGNLGSALTGGPVDAAEFPPIEPGVFNELVAHRPIKEIDYRRIQGDPYFVVRTAPADLSQSGRDRPHQPYLSRSGVDPDRFLIDARTMQVRSEPFSEQSLMARVKETFPEVPILESSLLAEYDSYYYSRDGQRPLPVLRVKFGDPVETWMYIDATMSRQVGAIHRLDRVERWIYNGFHSLDFSFWYYNAPLWYTGVIVLSLGGAAVSILGMYLGFKRMGRGAKRLAGL